MASDVLGSDGGATAEMARGNFVRALGFVRVQGNFRESALAVRALDDALQARLLVEGEMLT